MYSLVGNERLLVKSVRNLKEGQEKITRDLGVGFSSGKITNKLNNNNNNNKNTQQQDLRVFHPGESSNLDNYSL